MLHSGQMTMVPILRGLDTLVPVAGSHGVAIDLLALPERSLEVAWACPRSARPALCGDLS
ncbi:hypothetical protein XdyCFBP7245_03740 [Xanthomonas dyei]|uniref:Uncharacterized protein n=1 Tax=Xanthomonas dyei TaxID=743699 RepID=A0A2S7C971_9XANT|nr:hypothetical protein XdyCFBP7245_03740 [Xanthomonas dyei]